MEFITKNLDIKKKFLTILKKIKKTSMTRIKPYFFGALAGLLLVISVVTTDFYFGASTTFVRTTGFLGDVFIGADTINNLAYYQKYENRLHIQTLFVLGVFLGAFLSAFLTKKFKIELINELWKKRFGSNPVKRSIFAFSGGLIMVFGARLAGGCPTGHSISGISQLAVGSLFSTIFFFIGGVIVAHILYYRVK